MGFLHKIKASPYYERLKNSVQYRYDRRQFLIFAGVFGVILLLILFMFFALWSASQEVDALLLLMLELLAPLILIVYFAFRWLDIFTHIDSYIFCRVRLDHPHTQYRGGVSFTVEFTDRHGKILRRDTAAMFSSDWEPTLEEYNNQTVLIGYNEETDRVVVIGRENG